jgi:hypothetical protein
VSDINELKVKVLDFTIGLETVQTPFLADSRPVGSPSNVSFLIDAPDAYLTGRDGASVTLLLDRQERKRELPDGCYQIVHDPLGFTSDFRTWAEHVSACLREALIGVGLICVDFADFQTVLADCHGKLLTVDIIPFDDAFVIPHERLTRTHFRTLYAALLGGTDLTLSLFQDVCESLHQGSPDLTVDKFGMKITSFNPPQIVLLGELF